MSSSLLVLQFESRSPDANITTGGDALWWSAVTITTVGYGDYFPVTTLGRIAGVLVMLAGVGIIGALASILASLLVSPAPAKAEETEVAETRAAAAANQTVVARGSAEPASSPTFASSPRPVQRWPRPGRRWRSCDASWPPCPYLAPMEAP